MSRLLLRADACNAFIKWPSFLFQTSSKDGTSPASYLPVARDSTKINRKIASDATPTMMKLLWLLEGSLRNPYPCYA